MHMHTHEYIYVHTYVHIHMNIYIYIYVPHRTRTRRAVRSKLYKSCKVPCAKLILGMQICVIYASTPKRKSARRSIARQSSHSNCCRRR